MATRAQARSEETATTDGGIVGSEGATFDTGMLIALELRDPRI